MVQDPKQVEKKELNERKTKTEERRYMGMLLVGKLASDKPEQTG